MTQFAYDSRGRPMANGETWDPSAGGGVMGWLGRSAPTIVGSIFTAGALGAGGAGSIAGGGGAAGGAGVGATGATASSGVPWGSLFTAGANLFGNLFGAHRQSNAAEKAAQLQADAAKYAADQQTAAAQRAEAFERQQAENTYLNAEADRKGNYDQWAAGQRLHNSVRDALGYGSQDIPAYVAGVDPRFMDPSAPMPAAGAAPPNAGIAGNAAAVAATRMTPTPSSVASYLAQGPTTNVANAPIQPYDPRRVVPSSVGSYLRSY